VNGVFFFLEKILLEKERWVLQGGFAFFDVFGGKSVVSLWWIRGETWCFVRCFLAAKNMPTFRLYFRVIPVLGMTATAGPLRG
jgi:hypothetical protein